MISLNRGVRDSGGVVESEIEFTVGGAVQGEVVEAGEIVEELGLLAAISTEELEM